MPTFRAIISDVHGNVEALQAVLEEIAALNITDIYCLGDTVGYGPNPRECIDRIIGCQLVLMGNHEQGVMFDPTGWGQSAAKAIYWTRGQLEESGEGRQHREKRWEFLAALPRMHTEGDFLYVHGSPRNPINEYIFPEDIYNLRKLNRIFEMMKRYCFCGHTHLPGIFIEDGRFHEPAEIGYIYHLDQQKTICNVGSVGQPRDGDWRASYVLLVGTTIHFRRVEYDLETTVQKIYAIPDLDKFLGDRLREGK
ncbi:phosphoesterase [Planctomycetaceae bacterium SCGC AG-212-F19]|nr:phosphoesterase [Planctomycetaceae bacterium SCGC AG-212-F19]